MTEKEINKRVVKRYSIFKRILKDYKKNKLCDLEALSCLCDILESELTNVPQGVSQWREEGQRLGYWEYFKEQVLKEYREQRELDILMSFNIAGYPEKEAIKQMKIIINA